MTDEDAELLMILQRAKGTRRIIIRITERDRARLVEALELFHMQDLLAKTEVTRG